MKKKKEPNIVDTNWVTFKMPSTIPSDIKDPIHYIRGYNGANRCPLSIQEVEKLWLESIKK